MPNSAEAPLARLGAALEKIAAATKPPAEDLEEGIHFARLQAKRLRAVLELARPHLPRAVHRRERARLAAAARPLASARNEDVLREQLGAIVPAKADPSADRARLDRALGSLPAPAEWMPRGGPISKFEAFVWPGLKRTERKAREAMRKAVKNRGARLFHRWRKWAKRLSLQLLILEQAGLRVNRRACRKLDKLQHDLGKHHDLTMARKYARKHGAPGKLERKLRRERRTIEKRIVKCGEDLFGAKRLSAGEPGARWSLARCRD